MSKSLAPWEGVKKGWGAGRDRGCPPNLLQQVPKRPPVRGTVQHIPTTFPEKPGAHLPLPRPTKPWSGKALHARAPPEHSCCLKKGSVPTKGRSHSTTSLQRQTPGASYASRCRLLTFKLSPLPCQMPGVVSWLSCSWGRREEDRWSACCAFAWLLWGKQEAERNAPGATSSRSQGGANARARETFGVCPGKAGERSQPRPKGLNPAKLEEVEMRRRA